MISADVHAVGPTPTAIVIAIKPSTISHGLRGPALRSNRGLASRGATRDRGVLEQDLPSRVEPVSWQAGNGVFVKQGLSIVGFRPVVYQLSIEQHQACSELFDLLITGIKLILCSRNQQSERQRGK
jgi:hypothetical protein